MTTHTPGPWRFSDNTRYQSGPWKTNPYSVTVSAKGVHGTTVANIPNRASIPDEQKRANARLIAAAPDLLDALLLMLAACFDLEKDDEIARAAIRARAAIAKATAEVIG